MENIKDNTSTDQSDSHKEQWEVPVLLELNPSESQAGDFADKFDGDGGPKPS